MSFSSSTTSTSGRVTVSGAGFGGGTNSSRRSFSLRSQSCFGAAAQNLLLYAIGALQKQAPQLGQARLRSPTRQSQNDACSASNGIWHLWHCATYVAGSLIQEFRAYRQTCRTDTLCGTSERLYSRA